MSRGAGGGHRRLASMPTAVLRAVRPGPGLGRGAPPAGRSEPSPTADEPEADPPPASELPTPAQLPTLVYLPTIVRLRTPAQLPARVQLPAPTRPVGEPSGGVARERRTARGHRRLPALVLAAALALAGLGALALAVVGPLAAPGPPAVVASAGTIPPVATPPPAGDPVPRPAPPPLVLPPSVPVSLRIPRIAVSSDLVRLGLNPDNTVEVPTDFSTAGWYTEAPSPGQVGPAVILGHIDSYRGPAVFYRLGQLRPGDTADVTRADGLVARFVVDAVRDYPKDRFPTETVYGPVDYPGLRLITCGGDFDRRTRQYLDNVVVFAHLVPAAGGPPPGA